MTTAATTCAAAIITVSHTLSLAIAAAASAHAIIGLSTRAGGFFCFVIVANCYTQKRSISQGTVTPRSHYRPVPSAAPLCDRAACIVWLQLRRGSTACRRLPPAKLLFCRARTFGARYPLDIPFLARLLHFNDRTFGAEIEIHFSLYFQLGVFIHYFFNISYFHIILYIFFFFKLNPYYCIAKTQQNCEILIQY